jgi:uncharacterized repeat protein (TIGR03803 family)
MPYGGVVADDRGNLYGVTMFGGEPSARDDPKSGNGCGTVYQISPPSRAGKPWKRTILYRFLGTWDGCAPVGTLVVAPTGELYGTAMSGGSDSNCGTVFRLAPGKPNEPWVFQRLYLFTGHQDDETHYIVGDGCLPAAGLVRDQQGVLYGTASIGGAYSAGVVFRLAPSKDLDPPWDYSVLHHFRGAPIDGESPYARLLRLPNGTLMGTTKGGGSGGEGIGLGTIFRLRPPVNGEGPWTYDLLHSFAGGRASERTRDGWYPEAGLTLGASGKIFGTTSSGSAPYATVFEVLFNKAGEAKVHLITTIESWNSSFGYMQMSDEVAIDPQGRLLAFTSEFLFRLTQKKSNPKKWSRKWLHQWPWPMSIPNGAQPSGPPLIGSDGYLYGTTYYGGREPPDKCKSLNQNCGVVFRVKL